MKLMPVGMGVFFMSSLFFFSGCSSTKNIEIPKIQVDAIEHNQKGVDAVGAGDYDRASIDFQESLKLNISIDNQKGIAVDYLNLGRLDLFINRYDDAMTLFEKAIKIGFNTNDQFILSETYASIGRYYYLVGKGKDAIDILEKAIAIDSKEGYPTIGSKFNMMGMVYRDDSRFEEALKALSNALKANKSYGMKADSADSFRILGDIYLKKIDYIKARESYENALSIDKKLGSGAKISLDLYSLGMLFLGENNAKGALDFFLRAYAVDSSRGDYRRSLKSLDRIIETYNELGDKDNVAAYSLEKERLLQKENIPEKGGGKNDGHQGMVNSSLTP